LLLTFSAAKGLGTEMDIEEFAANIARPEPYLAGGSVAAHVGSFGAALGEMMAGLTEGRAKFTEQDAHVRQIHIELANIRKELRDLAEEDSAAYQSVLNARKLPKSSDEEKAVRGEAIERAIKEATEIPLRNVRAAFRALELLRILIDIGNPNARTDAAIGAQLAYASLKSTQYNVIANAPEISDKAFAESCSNEAGDLVQRAQEILQQIDLIMDGS
jgi:formiminotetrahydrofolate cyclodeaminase